MTNHVANDRARAGTGRLIAVFLYVWVMIGFVLGTALLLGPVRWMTGAARAAGWSQSAENALVMIAIGALVVGSLLVARALSRRIQRSRRSVVRMGIPAGATLFAAVSLWGWMNPGTLASSPDQTYESVQSASGAHFVFGPYPDAKRLEELKREGYTGVISLLHPAVVPFEPKILAEEKHNARELGIQLIHAPMLPWVGSNEESLRKLREVARSGKGRYYVHCYLGRDRANVAKRVLAEAGVSVAAGEDLKEMRSFAEREEPFERGAVMELEDGVWLIPYPNEPENFGYVLFGSVRHVVSLLDPADPEQSRWNRAQRALQADYAVPFSHEPLAPGDAARAREIAERVRHLPRPVAVIAPYTAPREDTRVADTFAAAYRSLDAPASAVADGHRRPAATQATRGGTE